MVEFEEHSMLGPSCMMNVRAQVVVDGGIENQGLLGGRVFNLCAVWFIFELHI